MPYGSWGNDPARDSRAGAARPPYQLTAATEASCSGVACRACDGRGIKPRSAMSARLYYRFLPLAYEYQVAGGDSMPRWSRAQPLETQGLIPICPSFSHSRRRAAGSSRSKRRPRQDRARWDHFTRVVDSGVEPVCGSRVGAYLPKRGRRRTMGGGNEDDGGAASRPRLHRHGPKLSRHVRV